MSLSGPCVWLSSLSPPSGSHLPAITSHWSTAPWNSDQASSRPRALPPRLPGSWEKESEPAKPPSIDMQPAALKAENAFTTVAPAGTSSPVQHAGGPASFPNPESRITEPVESPTSRMKLEKIDRSDPHFPRPPGTVSPQVMKQRTPDLKDREAAEQQDRDRENSDAAMASSDDGAESSVGGDKKQSSDSKSEKKKMKRFRLTHNQTRFLMSEFTRQAHPDASHRERLSKEIPGLTPRQVQVWFQNRRAKLKRLTSNDRERILKSRALPDDFDTTQVLRTPFDHKTSSEAPMLLTDGLPRLNDDDYVISPLSSASTTGNFSSAVDRHFENYPQAGMPARAGPAPLSDIHRNNRSAFPFPRSSSFSETYNRGLHFPGQFSRPGVESLGHPSMAYARRPVDYGLNRPANGLVVGYDHQRAMEGSVSPTGPPDQPVQYNVENHRTSPPRFYGDHALTVGTTRPANTQLPVLAGNAGPKGYAGMEINPHIQQQGRQIPAMHSVPVSEAPDYRPYSYDHHPYSMSHAMPYSHPNASSMSLPASLPSDSNSVSQGPVVTSAEDRMNHPPPQLIDPLRAKFGNQTFEYANYL
ncbi:homeobox transcription factor [Aspergillus heteromorphus CBS 117.55]|uniref:Homeobox transcription factor n=1 Tax=Aspergillus heteromorphus CBS 117.55 TaxID=1448321 RepID=A0A317US21_9EURO|nr:homeobox transcription factor [Aspergillus heteromorphus CBS 117.55]PWY64764.1 homeobox transcription factor [Aspergillus heteromorphus CBS 117.55]